MLDIHKLMYCVYTDVYLVNILRLPKLLINSRITMELFYASDGCKMY